MPRVRCDKCGVKKISVPWARPDSGFTLLFEALVMTMVSAMPVKAVARIVGEHDTRLWRVVHHYVDQARARTDASGVTRVAIDETAARRGHDYITLFVDIDQARVLFATEGKDADTVAAFADDLTAHGGDPEAISEVCIDMSPAFIKGIAENLPECRHHLRQVPCRQDHQRCGRSGAPRRTEDRKACCAAHVTSGCAIPPTCRSASARRSTACPPLISRPRAPIRSDWPSRTSTTSPPPRRPAAFLKKWYFWATHSRLEPIIDAARTVKRHWDGILRWFDSKIANGLIEGINSLVQAAKAKARGYRSTRNLKAIVYLLAGKLDLRLPA